jgi:hypothetical protein
MKITKSSIVSKVLVLQRDNDIIGMLLDGKPKQDIINFICLKYQLTEGSANVYISKCKEIIKERKRFEINTLVSIHIQRYEYIYTKLNELGAWFAADQALKAKEKLLGFHREGFHMKVTQGEIQQVQQSVVTDEYDLKKLTPEQLDRFNFLIEKARSKTGYNDK